MWDWGAEIKYNRHNYVFISVKDSLCSGDLRMRLLYLQRQQVLCRVSTVFQRWQSKQAPESINHRGVTSELYVVLLMLGLSVGFTCLSCLVFQGCPGSPASHQQPLLIKGTTRWWHVKSTQIWCRSPVGRKTVSRWSWAPGWSSCPVEPWQSTTPQRLMLAFTAVWWKTWGRQSPAMRPSCR